jgi:hypothetical protein
MIKFLPAPTPWFGLLYLTAPIVFAIAIAIRWRMSRQLPAGEWKSRRTQLLFLLSIDCSLAAITMAAVKF